MWEGGKGWGLGNGAIVNNALAIDIGGTHFRLGLFDHEGCRLVISEGDTAALHIVREAARWLARGLLTVIRILNPDRIVLGGGLTWAGRVLLAPLHQHLAELASPTIGYSTGIVIAELGTHSPLHGAAAMALDLM